MIDSKHLEESILGTLIIWPERYEDISGICYPFMFSEAIRPLADYIWYQASEGNTLELYTLIQDVQAAQIAKPEYILAITDSPALDDVKQHAEKLREAYIIREDTARYARAHKAMLSGKGFAEVRAAFDADIAALDNMVEIRYDRRGQAIKEAYDHLVKGLENDGISGVTTGHPEMDDHTGGWQPGNLIIIGARPGMGKTTIALDWVEAAASAGQPVMFVSLEMTQTEVLYKLAAKFCNIPPSRLQRSLISKEETTAVWKALEHISTLPLFIFDDTNIDNTLQSVRDTARRLQRKDGLSLIVVDYLQLMKGEGQTKNERTESISQGLKRIAKQIGVPVIALSQLSRAVEIRGGSKRPQMADLRDSGSLEQDGDIVGFIYRPEYYGIEEDETGQSLKGKVEVFFSKHRMGSPRSFWFDYDSGRDSYRNRVSEPSSQFPAHSMAIPASSRPGPEYDVPF